MPQIEVPLLTVVAVNSTGLQETVSQQAGTKVAVGQPTGPVVFASTGRPIVAVLAGSAARSVVGSYGPGR